MIRGERYPVPRWRVIQASVRGASHVRSGLPNQDRAQAFPETGEHMRVLLALADGHGSAKYFRSHRGAEFAVSVAVAVLKPLLLQQLEIAGLSAIKRWATDQLPQKLVKAWRDRVQADFEHHRSAVDAVFSSEEHTVLQEHEGKAAVQAVEANPFLAYGSTIVIALVTEFFILYVQLGDGDILAVAHDGEVTRPLPADQRLLANETTSLCSQKAWNDFRVHFQVVQEPAATPALILISTDGYANSFRDEHEFLKVGSDFLHILQAGGLDAMQEQLAGWLDEASQQGSGDDISLGIIAHMQLSST